MDCVSRIKVDSSDCLQQCSGLLVTSYDQQEIEYDLDFRFSKLAEYFSRKDFGQHRNMANEFKGSFFKMYNETFPTILPL